MFTRINFSIGGNTVGVHDILEASGEFVQFVVCRRSAMCVQAVQNRLHRRPRNLLNPDLNYFFGLYRSMSQSTLNSLDVIRGHPTFGNKTFLRDVQVEQVQSVEDGFEFQDLKKAL